MKKKSYIPKYIQLSFDDSRDLSAGAAARDAGIAVAVEHADAKSPSWSARAYEMLKQFLLNHNSSFMAEDVRMYAEALDFAVPPNKRAWGGVIAKASRKGLIKQIGTKRVKNKDAHCANAAVWVQSKPIGL